MRLAIFKQKIRENAMHDLFFIFSPLCSTDENVMSNASKRVYTGPSNPNNPNNIPLGQRPMRPTFGGPQSSDQAPLLPDQCRSGSAPKPLLPELSSGPGQSDPKQQPPLPKQNIPNGRPGDWICAKCNKHNFSRRTDCFGCKAPKQEAQQQQNNRNQNATEENVITITDDDVINLDDDSDDEITIVSH